MLLRGGALRPRPMLYRDATPADADALAALHAASWASAYRGLLSDAYLDGPMAGERLALWRERLGPGGSPRAGGMPAVTVVAEEGGALVGLACLLTEPTLYIDNLHVTPGRKGGGIGRRLMAEVVSRLPVARRAEPVRLTVLEGNHPARAFYDRLGGRVVETILKTGHDGLETCVLAYEWAPASRLLRTP